jgi:hypothetical protein
MVFHGSGFVSRCLTLAEDEIMMIAIKMAVVERCKIRSWWARKEH